MKQRCQVDCSPVLVQGSGEHGAVSSLPVGVEQASGRVDVPDGAKIDAAAAFAGTFRSWLGKLDALRSVLSREGKVQNFLKECDGHTRVIRCHDFHSINDVVGYDGWDIYVTLHGNILNLSDALDGVGLSDNNTMHVHCRLRGGSNNMDIFGQWQCGDCAATRCWPVLRNCCRSGAPRPDNPPTPAPWNDGKNKG